MIYNDLPPLKKNSTCAVTGHRILASDFSVYKLKNDLENIINRGFDLFLIGMATGFDTECFSALEELKKDYPAVKLAAIIPCLDQSAKFRKESKELYEKMLLKADYKAVLFENYQKDCMLLRNDFLVKNSSLLYAYYNGSKRGGTFYTLNRAKKNGVLTEFY